jgi:hypothetical protein
MRKRKIGFVNVGANSTHGSLRSPIFEDNTFEFVPIPDSILNLISHDRGIRYRDLKAYNGVEFGDFIPHELLHQFAHADPDFKEFTYGDYPNHSPRASNLRKLQSGDYLVFFSRLVPWVDGRFSSRGAFYLIGFFEIGQIFANVLSEPEKDFMEQVRTNAHMIRGKCDPLLYDGFWIWKGTTNSRRLGKAIPLDRKTVQAFDMKDRRGHEWDWNKFHSEVAAIGSYLRSVRILTDQSQVNRILRVIS